MSLPKPKRVVVVDVGVDDGGVAELAIGVYKHRKRLIPVATQPDVASGLATFYSACNTQPLPLPALPYTSDCSKS
jgi:hypothetical protein